jgi:uncharacterized membrane protein YvbJ
MASEKPRNTIKESCPNCGHTKSKNDTECTECGIIYEKHEKIQNRKNEEKEKHKNEWQLKSKKLEEEKQKKRR